MPGVRSTTLGSSSTLVEPLPGGRRDDPGDDVEGKDLLGALLGRVDRDRDPVVPEHLRRQAMAPLELGGAQPVEVVVQAPVGWSWLPDGRKHLVVEAVELVAEIE